MSPQTTTLHEKRQCQLSQQQGGGSQHTGNLHPGLNMQDRMAQKQSNPGTLTILVTQYCVVLMSYNTKWNISTYVYV